MWRQQSSGYQPSVLVGEFTISDTQGKVLQKEQLYLRVPKGRDIFATLSLFAYLQECSIISSEIYQGLLSKGYIFDGNLDVKLLPIPSDISTLTDDALANVQKNTSTKIH
jgi:hypothetical protein